MNSARRIALPRCLTYYYSFYEVWASFFAHFNLELVLSPPTNRWILEKGKELSPPDICLPVKAAMGHCAWLAEKTDCDALFLPRLLSPFAPCSSCPKIAGFVDNVMLNFKKSFSILDAPFNTRYWEGNPRQHLTTLESFDRVLEQLGIARPRNLANIVDEATSKIYEVPSDVRMPSKDGKRTGLYAEHDLKVCLVGRTYTVLDKTLNMNIPQLINRYGISYTMYDDYPFMSLGNKAIDAELTSVIDEPSKFLSGLCLHLLETQAVDGIIYISFFPCGPDSVVFGILQNYFKEQPPLILVLDEHTGEAGLVTRLEAFFDTLVARKTRRMAC